MKENKKATKLRAYLPIIILGIVLVASAIGLAITAINKNADKTANAGFMTLEEIDQLEESILELTEEEIAALKEDAKNGVKDELTLRLLLLLDDEIKIKVSNNMELIAGMKVNGTKTLTGDANLKMFLGSERNTMEDAILIVTRGNSLNMDGLVLDGNGVCHAILVQEGATLDYSDGTIQYASSYGIYNQGTTTVSGGTLTKCMAAAIGVKAGAKTYVTGGNIKDNYKNHIWSADGSTVEVTGGVFDHSYEHAIYNRGTLTMTGGTIKNSNSANACAVANFGKAYIDGGDDYIEISNCVTGFFSEDDEMEVNKVYGHDLVRNFLRIKDGKGKVTNCKIENTGTYAVRAGGEVTIENIYAENLGTHGIYISPGKVTVKNVEVKNAKEYGFVNVGGEATATDITITGAGTSAFINYDSTFNGKGEKGLLTLSNCVATDCRSNLLVRGGTSVKVSDCVFNKTIRTNVHMTEGTAELTNVKLLGSTDADCSIVSIRKDAKATLKNVEMAYGNRGISLAGKVTVMGGSIHDNKGDLAGNAIRTEENAIYHLEGVKIYKNHNTSTTMAGGVGFMAKGSHGTIIDCEITENTSVRTVGGIYAEQAELNIRGTLFKKNHTSGSEGKGGAILLEKTKSIIRECTFEDNSTETKYQNVGGAIFSKAGSDLTIRACKFINNASGRGGAIANTGTLSIVEGTTFTGNTCTEGGAGVYNGGNGAVTDTGSIYKENALTEVHAGGAIRNDGTNTKYSLVGVILKENSSKGDAGAIYNTGTMDATDGCEFIGNKGNQGGALYNKGTVTLKNAIFDETSYEGNGGGCIYVSAKAKLNLDSVEMKNIGTGKDNHAIINNGGSILSVKDAKKTLSIDNVAGHGVVNMGKGTIELVGVSIQNVSGPERHGVYSENGSVDLKDVAIQNVTKDAVYVKGGTATVEDATIENIKRAAITATDKKDDKTKEVVSIGEVTLKNVTVKLPENATEEARAAQYGIYCIRGKVNVDNVNIANTGSTKDDHAVLNDDGVIKSVEGAAKSITITDTTGHGIANANGGTTTLVGVSITDVVRDGVYSNDGSVTVNGLTVDKKDNETSSRYGVHATGQNAVIYLSSATINDTGSHGIFAEKGGSLGRAEQRISNVTINNAKEEGIRNDAGVLFGEEIFINKSVKRALDLNNSSEADINGLYVDTCQTEQGIRIRNSSKAIVSGFSVNNTSKAAVYIENSGTVVMQDSADGVKGTINKAGSYGIYVKNNNKDTVVTIDGVTISEAGSYGLGSIDIGPVVAKNVEIIGSKTAGIRMEAGTLKTETVTINGGKHGIEGIGGTVESLNAGVKGVTISVPNYGISHKTGEMTVKDVSISGGICGALSNNSTLNVENTSISGCTKYGVLNNSGILNLDAVTINGITDGTNDKSGGYGIRVASGTATAENVTITNSVRAGVSIKAGKLQTADVSITGGKHGIEGEGGTVESMTTGVKGVTISVPNYGINHINNSDTGTMTIKDVIISGGTCGALNAAKSLNLVNVDVAECTKFGILNNGGTLFLDTIAVENITDGTKDATGGYGIRIVENTTATAKDVTVVNAERAGIRIEKGTLNANNVTVTGGPIGIDAVGGTVQLAEDATKGVIVSGATYGINHKSGEATVKDVDINGGKCGVFNDSTDTISLSNIDISGCGKYGVLNNKNGVLNLEDVTVSDITKVSDGSGGHGINISKGTVNVTTGLTINDVAGYGVALNGGTATLKDTTISDTTLGGICLANGTTLKTNDVTISGFVPIETKGGTVQKADGASFAITVIPANYAIDEIIVKGQAGTETQVEAISNLVTIQQDQNSPDTSWFVNNGGKLGKTVVNAEAKIGDNEYSTLQEALDAATEGTTIVLLKDVTVSEPIEITKDLTFQSERKVTITRADSLIGQAKSSLITVTSGKLSFIGTQGKEIVIDGNAQPAQNERIRAISVAQGAELHMEYASVQNFYTCNGFNEAGNAIYNAGTATLTNVAFTNNKTGTSTAGGTIRNTSTAVIAMTDCKITGSATNSSGGAFYANNGAQVTLTNCEFAQNTSGAEGGAIYFNGTSEFVINNCTFKDNTAVKGGAISVKAATINGASFTNNTATTANDVFLKDAAHSLTVSGAFEGATVAYSGDSAGIKIAGQVTGDITITPYSYTAGTQLVQKANEEVADDAYSSSLSSIKVAQNGGDVWFLNNEGKLTKAVAVIDNAYYTDFASALTAAEKMEEATISLADSVSLSQAIVVDNNLTIKSTKAVSITWETNATTDMIKVSAGKEFKILGEADKEITVERTKTSKSSSHVIYNSGITELEHVIIKGGRIGVQSAGTNITINNSTIQDTGNKGLTIADGNATIKNSIIKNTADNGIFLYKDGKGSGVKNVEFNNVTVNDVNGSDKHGINIAEGSVTIKNELRIERVSGHGIAVTGGSMVTDSTVNGHIIVSGANSSKRCGIYTTKNINVVVTSISDCTYQIGVNGTSVTATVNGNPLTGGNTTNYHQLPIQK